MSAFAESPPDTPDSAGTVSVAPGERSSPTRSAADRFMRRLLRIPADHTSTAAEAQSAFQKSIMISATRCLLMYIIFPFVLPAVGIAKGVGPAIGLVIGALAVVSIIYSVRRFWRADHSKRWHYTVFGTSIIAFLLYSSVVDIAALVG